jgi:hypothetical protein
VTFSFTQVYPEIILPRILTSVETTFTAWNRDNKPLEFAFDTRPANRSVCKQPYLFYMAEVQFDESSKRLVSFYKRFQDVDKEKKKNYCWSNGLPPSNVQSIRVVSEPITRKFYTVWTRALRIEFTRLCLKSQLEDGCSFGGGPRSMDHS